MSYDPSHVPINDGLDRLYSGSDWELRATTPPAAGNCYVRLYEAIFVNVALIRMA